MFKTPLSGSFLFLICFYILDSLMCATLMKIGACFMRFWEVDLANFGVKVGLGMNTFGRYVEGLEGVIFNIFVYVYILDICIWVYFYL